MTWMIAISMRERNARTAARGSLCGIGSSGMVLPAAFAGYLDILRKPRAEEIQRFFQTGIYSDPRLPAGDALKGCVVRPIVADIDRFALRRKILNDEAAAAVRGHKCLRQRSERQCTVTPDVVNASLGLWRRRRQQESVGGVLDVSEIPLLLAAPELERLALQDGAEPGADEGLAGIADAHARTVGVGEPERGRAQAMDPVVKQMEGLAGELVDAVHVDGPERMALVDRQVV